MKWSALFLPLLLLAACATAPEMKEPPVDYPKEAVMFREGYQTVFDKTVHALEGDGYEIAVADRQAGIIQTHPKVLNIAPEGSQIQYRGVYMIRLDGDSGRSWGVIRFALLPELPGERENLVKALQGEEAPAQ
ncbi:MAG TPA: hypothetical protein VFA47_00100 [Candidatus Manganitrophaceae bacterium]|nr:hypothetical protein [Candidatus Manganitrophaceae bacterium]